MNWKKSNYLFLLIGIITFLFSSGKWNVPITAWIWPLCFMLFLHEKKSAKRMLIVLAAMIIDSFIKWKDISGNYFVLNIIIAILLGLIYFSPFIIDFWICRGKQNFVKTLILPLAFVCVEFFMGFSPISVLGTISSTQTANEPLMQLAAVFGSYGITFIVIWFASVLTYVIENREDNTKSARRALCIYSGVLVIVMFAGGLRISFSSYDTPTVKIAMATGPKLVCKNNIYEQIPFEDNLNSMEESVKTAAGGKGDILLFCEEAFTLSDIDEDRMNDYAKKAAKENNIDILITYEIKDTDNSNNGLSENKEYFIDQNGEEIWEYNKTKLVFGSEVGYFTKGSGDIPNKVVTMPSGIESKMASAICFDTDFQGFLRDKLDSDTSILMVPTWDWDAIRAYHINWVRLRAIENGVSYVRSTYEGISSAIDPYGITIMKSDTAAIGYEKVVFADVPARGVKTIYNAAGKIIDWLYVVALVLLSVFIMKRSSSKPEN